MADTRPTARLSGTMPSFRALRRTIQTPPQTTAKLKQTPATAVGTGVMAPCWSGPLEAGPCAAISWRGMRSWALVALLFISTTSWVFASVGCGGGVGLGWGMGGGISAQASGAAARSKTAGRPRRRKCFTAKSPYTLKEKKADSSGQDIRHLPTQLLIDHGHVIVTDSFQLNGKFCPMVCRRRVPCFWGGSARDGMLLATPRKYAGPAASGVVLIELDGKCNRQST